MLRPMVSKRGGLAILASQEPGSHLIKLRGSDRFILTKYEPMASHATRCRQDFIEADLFFLTDLVFF